MKSTKTEVSLSHSKVLIILGIIGGLGIASSDLYVSSLPTFSALFDVSPFLMNLTLAIYFMATSLGCLSFTYFSQKYSHFQIHFISFLIFIMGGLIIALNNDYNFILSGRLLQGVGYGLIQANLFAFMKKKYRDNFGQSLSLYALACEAFCILAPLMGTSLIYYLSWNAPFLFLSFLSVILFALSKKDLKQVAMEPSSNIWNNIRELFQDKQFIKYNTLSFIFIGCGWGMITISPYLIGDDPNLSFIHSMFYGFYTLLYALGCLVIERSWIRRVHIFHWSFLLICSCLCLLTAGFYNQNLYILGVGLILFGLLSGLLYGPVLEQATLNCPMYLVNSASTFLVLFRLVGSGAYVAISAYLYSLDPNYAYMFFMISLLIAAKLIYGGRKAPLQAAV